MHTKWGKYDNYEKMNPVLAKDKKLVNAIIGFMENNTKYSVLRWGGSFGLGSGVLQNDTDTDLAERGVKEFHHFEFKDYLRGSHRIFSASRSASPRPT